MRRNFKVLADEYGYSIYDKSNIRVLTGSPHKMDVYRELVELEAYSAVYDSMDIDDADRLYSCVQTVGRYYGRTIKNIDKIKTEALKLYMGGL